MLHVVHHHRALRLFAQFTCVAGFAACVETPATSGAGGSFDTDAFPMLGLEEELRIGSIDDPDLGFSRIGMVDVDSEGEVYVAETLDREIRVYSPTGEFLRRIGGPGEGPGEFQAGITRLGVTGDTVWAIDTQNLAPGWLLLFHRDGEPLSKRMIERVTTDTDEGGRCNLISPRMRAADGHFLGQAGSGLICGEPASPTPSGRPPPIPRVRFDDQGRVVDTAGWYEIASPAPMEFIEVGASEYIVPRPPYLTPAQILLPDGRVQVDRAPAESSEPTVFRVTRLAFPGDTVYSTTYAYRPVPYPEFVLDAAVALRARSGGMVALTASGEVKRMERSSRDSAAAHRTLRDRMPYPAVQPPVQGYHRGSDGRLWLEREDTDPDSIRWTILDPAGLPVGDLSTPRDGSRIVWSAGDVLWAVETGDFDVPWLVRYRIASR